LTYPRIKVGIDFDYMRTVIDDRYRLAYGEVLTNENGTAAAGFLMRAVEFCRQNGVDHIERGISHNAWVTAGQRPLNPRSLSSGRCESSSSYCPRIKSFNRPWALNGLTTAHTSATPNAPKPWTPGCPTKTMNASTPASEQNPPTECHLADGQLQIAGRD